MIIKYSENFYLDGELSIRANVPYILEADSKMDKFFVEDENNRTVCVDEFNGIGKIYTSENKLFFRYNFNRTKRR